MYSVATNYLNSIGPGPRIVGDSDIPTSRKVQFALIRDKNKYEFLLRTVHVCFFMFNFSIKLNVLIISPRFKSGISANIHYCGGRTTFLIVLSYNGE